ncbi:MAG TPA: hypothetical protein VG206_25095 [Terriglobia bacterium]|nr:hypothetical protein [Terriglobia bacterium]
MSILEDQIAEVARAESEVAAPPVPAGFAPGAAASRPSKFGRLLRAVFSFPVLLIAMVMTIVSIFAGGGVSDPDLFLHLRNAEYILTHRAIPLVDSYSFTVNGQPWINHEWLAEIPYYLAWHSLGLIGVKILAVLLVQIIFGLVVYYCYQCSGNLKASTFVCALAVLLGVVSFGPRTLLFGYIYLLILLLILERFRTAGRAPLWIIPPLFCLWINTHGSWSMGMVVFAIFIASGLVTGQWGRIEARRWSPGQLRKLLVTLGASIPPLFLNPFGYRLVTYPLSLASRGKLIVTYTEEWLSVNFHDPRGKIVFLVIVSLLLAALAGRYRWKLHEVGFIVFGLYSGLTYVRFLFFLGIVLAPVLASYLRFLPPYRREADKPALNALILAAMIALMFHSFPSPAELKNSIDKDYPAEILPYLKAYPPSGPVFNDYLWGGYLGWHDREFKDFVDSRADIFEYAGVLRDYFDVQGVRQPDKILDKYNIRYVLFPPDAPLSYLLMREPTWKPIFKGKVSVLFERANAAEATR